MGEPFIFRVEGQVQVHQRRATGEGSQEKVPVWTELWVLQAPGILSAPLNPGSGDHLCLCYSGQQSRVWLLGPECPISVDVLGGKEDTQGCPQALALEFLLEESRRTRQPSSALT